MSGDCTTYFQEQLRDAVRDSTSVYLRGGGSKLSLFGRVCEAPFLDTTAHNGVIKYEPEELVVTARSGTRIAELQEVVAEHGQILPFEAASFSDSATLGGSLACGLSGPARPWKGSIRDAVLGVRLIDGHGDLLRFGGEVVKNVAGYDVSRLQAGALGTLGLITEVSFRVLPKAKTHLHLISACPVEDAIMRLRELARRPWPLTGLAWCDSVLHLRLHSDHKTCRDIQRSLVGFEAPAADLKEPAEGLPAPLSGFWDYLREYAFLAEGELASCIDLAPATPLSQPESLILIDWGGARRIYGDDLSWEEAQAIARDGKGHATRLGCGLQDLECAAMPAEALRNLQKRIKLAVDPHGVFNPRRLYSWL
ncbi:MAG: glycolate oxidase subunit GlcE [Congregibacter sp.]